MGGGDDKGGKQRTAQHEDKTRAQQQGEERVLRVVENTKTATATATGKADEKNAEGGKVGNGIGIGVENASLRKSFEWPEDVF